MGRFKYTCIIITINFAFNKLVRGATENKTLGKETIKQIIFKTLLNSLKSPLVVKGIELFLLTASAHPPRHKIIVTQGAGKANKYKSYSLSQRQTVFNQSFSESSRSFLSTQVIRMLNDESRVFLNTFTSTVIPKSNLSFRVRNFNILPFK